MKFIKPLFVTKGPKIAGLPKGCYRDSYSSLKGDPAMKMAISPATAAMALLLALVWPPSEGRAGVHQDELRTGGHFGWHSVGPGNKHPKKAMNATMMVDQNFLNSDGVYYFCVTYPRWEGVNNPDKGILKAKVEVIKSNGEQRTAAKFSAEVLDHWASLRGARILVVRDGRKNADRPRMPGLTEWFIGTESGRY